MPDSLLHVQMKKTRTAENIFLKASQKKKARPITGIQTAWRMNRRWDKWKVKSMRRR